jgi:hypothetical protein
MSEPERQNARGRPVFMPDEPIAERLVRMVTALVTELAVLRERVDTLEKLATDKGVLEPAAVDAFQPDAEVEAARRQWREQYLARVFGDLQAEVKDALSIAANKDSSE